MKRICGPLLLVLLAAAWCGARASDTIGPLAWSEDGSHAFTWHEGRVMDLDLREGGMAALTDSMPPPLAVAVDERNGLLAVARPSDRADVTVYALDGSGSILCYRLSEAGPVYAMHSHDGDLGLVGRGFAARLDMQSGAAVDSLPWIGRPVPVDILFEQSRMVVLQSEEIVEYGREARTVKLDAGGMARALFPAGEGRALLIERGRDLLLRLPDGSTRPGGTIEEDERFAGAQYSAAGEKLLLVIERPGTREGNRTTRLEVRDARTGERIQFLRSTRMVGGVDTFEPPYAAAIHPNGRWLLVDWLLTGIQLWDMDDWMLLRKW